MPEQPLPRRTLVWRAGLPLAAVWIACIALNLFKAVHIDDAAHLAIAEHIARDPLHPMAAEVFWQDRPAPASELNQPHLFFYLIAGLAALGAGLPAMHLALAAFTGLALLSTYRIVHRVSGDSGSAVTAAALIGLGPALAPSQNLMTDVPLLALFLLALDGLIPRQETAGTDRPSESVLGRTVFTATVIGLACLLKYTSLVLLPVFAWWLWRRQRTQLSALLIPLAMLGLWSAFNLWDYGQIHLLGRPISVSDDAPNAAAAVGLIFGRAALWVITLGALSPFTLGFAKRAGQRLGRRSIGLTAAIALPVITVGGQLLAAYGPEVLRGETIVHSFLRGLFFLNGCLAIGLGIGSWKRLRRRPDGQLLALWISANAVFIVVLSPFVAVRHVLLVLPPLLALYWADPEHRPSLNGRRAALALSMIIGLGVGVADWRIADVYRALPNQLPQAEGRTLYLGHWGFQYYAEAAGWRPYVPGQTQLRAGDRLVHPMQVDAPEVLPGDLSRLSLTRTHEIEASPLDLFRTVTPRLGYYSVWHGLPWTLSLAPLERVEVYEVLPDVSPEPDE